MYLLSKDPPVPIKIKKWGFDEAMEELQTHIERWECIFKLIPIKTGSCFVVHLYMLLIFLVFFSTYAWCAQGGRFMCITLHLYPSIMIFTVINNFIKVHFHQIRFQPCNKGTIYFFLLDLGLRTSLVHSSILHSEFRMIPTIPTVQRNTGIKLCWHIGLAIVIISFIIVTYGCIIDAIKNYWSP